MIKTDAPIMQDCFQAEEVDVSTERRIFLARKGQALYGKYCGTRGRGICSKSFAEYHLWRGELVVVRDFLAYLKTQVALLEDAKAMGNPVDEKLAITNRLIERVGDLLGEKQTEDAPCALGV